MRIAVAISLAATLGVSGPVMAQDNQGSQAPPKPQLQTTNPVGEYSGVEPGEGAPKGVRRRGKRPRVTWVGFVPGQGGSSRAFVQVDREAAYRQEIRKDKLVVLIEGAVFADRNNRRRMDTRFFDTAISHIVPSAQRSKRRDRGVEIAFHFKNPADLSEAALSTTTGKDGFTYVIAEFGAGSGEPEATSQL